MSEINWQPIETAPRDGTRVLGWNGHEVSCMRHGERHNWHWEASWDYGGYGTEYEADHHEFGDLTHWAPLPEPPK